MSESFAERFYHLLEDVEDCLTRGHRVEHEPFEPIGGAPPTPGAGELSRAERLRRLEELVLSCTRCPLHEGRRNAVPGIGVLDPEVMVIGEGPGGEEDRQGIPFVGPAGHYLDKWLAA
ncbi:MAG: uracil-DNA glycosylase family protein, partial [Alkalispirochaetaceae bacterium]